MKPFINLNDLEDFKESNNGPFQSKYATISEKIGAKKLGYNLSIVPPGKKVCPFHNHWVNEEMFLILEGSGILRFGEEEYPIKENDIIACPPGGRDVAHQIVNTGTEDIKYLSLSTSEPYEICEYPDSNKILSVAGKEGRREISHISKFESAVDYFEGENK